MEETKAGLEGEPFVVDVPAFKKDFCIAVLDYLCMLGKLLSVTKRYIFVVFHLICR